MKKTILFESMLKNILICSFALCASNSWSEVTNKSLFDASIKFDQEVKYYYVSLESVTSHFLCINTLSIDTAQGFIVLTDSNGKRIRQRKITDSPAERELGFNFSPPYLILRPGELRRQAIDVSNFEITEGKYHYSIIIDAYSCKDVVDESRIKVKREVKGVSIEREGYIEISKEFIKLNDHPRDQGRNNITVKPESIGHEAMHKVN